MTAPVRFAAVGLGSYVARQAVLPALRTSSFTTLQGVASSRHGEFSGYLLPGESQYDSLGEVLADDTVEAVYLATPNHLHFEMIRRCIACKRHVLCEKPLVLSANEVRELAAQAAKEGVVVAEAYMTSYHPRLRALLELSQIGDLGDIVAVHSSFTGTLVPFDGYRLRRDQGGGSLWDVGIYALAPVIALLGPSPLEVAVSTQWDVTSGVDLSLSAFLVYEAGRSATITTSFVAAETQSLEVVGSECFARITRSCTPQLQDTAIELGDRQGRLEARQTDPGDPYLSMVNEVGRAFRECSAPQWNLSHTEEVVKLVSRIYEIARKGRSDGSW